PRSRVCLSDIAGPRRPQLGAGRTPRIQQSLRGPRVCYGAGIHVFAAPTPSMTDKLDVLLADGVIDEVLGRLKSGKEANISLVRRGELVIAAKVYKDR